MIKTFLTGLGLVLLFALMLFFVLTVLGCNDRQIRKSYTKADFKTDEAWNWFICTQSSQKTQDSILKDKINHNVLECQPLINDLIDRNKFERSKELYDFCKDKRAEGHSWQNCYDKILVK